jgi:hypothetical protein
MELKSYEFRAPAELIEAVAERVPLREDTAWLVLVASPSTEQRVVRVDSLTTSAVSTEWETARDEMYDVISTWSVPDIVPPTHSAVLVLVRRGLCVFGPHEKYWHLAWRYINHCRPMYSGHVILVTEHGWVDFMTKAADVEPALMG